MFAQGTLARGNVFLPGRIGRVRGLGDVVPQIVGTGVTSGAAVTAAFAAPGAVSVLGLAVPIAGAVAAVGLIIYGWIQRRGAQRIAATSVVNEAEPYLEKNRDAFLTLPNPTAADQAAALQYFDAVWAQVVKECAQVQLDNAGHACIEDRLPAGVTVSTPVGSMTGNGQWDWFAYYRDPIAEAPIAPPPPPPAGLEALGLEAAFGLPAGSGGLSLWALVGLALIGVGVFA